MRMYNVDLKSVYEEFPARDPTEGETEADEETGADIGKEEALKYEELLGRIDSLLGMHCHFLLHDIL